MSNYTVAVGDKEHHAHSNQLRKRDDPASNEPWSSNWYPTMLHTFDLHPQREIDKGETLTPDAPCEFARTEDSLEGSTPAPPRQEEGLDTMTNTPVVLLSPATVTAPVPDATPREEPLRHTTRKINPNRLGFSYSIFPTLFSFLPVAIILKRRDVESAQQNLFLLF